MTGWAGGLLEAEGARRLPGARYWQVQVRVFNSISCLSGLVIEMSRIKTLCIWHF